MTKSYAQIQKQISDLQRKADALRQREVAGVIGRIKIAIDHYQLLPSDLFDRAALRGTATSKALGVSEGKGAVMAYSDGGDNIWRGRGPRPKWLRNALAEGHALEEYLVAGSGTSMRPKVAKKKRVGQAKYRGSDGQTWTGMGPQPRWIKEALANGNTLTDLLQAK